MSYFRYRNWIDNTPSWPLVAWMVFVYGALIGGIIYAIVIAII